MPTSLNLNLNALPVDMLRGPGSSSTEQIPSTSSELHSPSWSSFDAFRFPDQSRRHPLVETINDRTAHSEVSAQDDEQGLHVVVVGGNVGAFATSLALAKSEDIRVTLVNVGVGSLSVTGEGNVAQGALLNAQTIACLEQCRVSEGTPRRASRHGVPFDLEDAANRWKGKSSVDESFGIGERIREEGVRLESYSFFRYRNGDQLMSQQYTISTGEDVAMTAINTDTLISILRDACLSHPRIDVRPRGIVRAVLPGACAPTAQSHHVQNSTSGNGSSSTAGRTRVGTRERTGVSARSQERRRKARESFIQLDDDEIDVDSPIHPFSLLSSATSAPSTGSILDELLRGLPIQSQEHHPFSDNRTPDEIKPGIARDGESRPAVLLTSGEKLEADAVLGTEGPVSKVLDAIHSGRRSDSEQVLRQDGIFRANIPIARLLEDVELANFVEGQESNSSSISTWVGPGCFLSAFPICSETLYVALAVQGGRAREEVTEEDEDLILARRMKNEVSDWCPRARKLVELVDSATYETLFDYNQVERWVSDSGRVALLGDAAHPILPFAHQGLTATIADALTLGGLFSKPFEDPSYLDGPRAPHLVPRLLNAFTSIRRPLSLRAQLTVRADRDLFWLDDGDRQQLRDKMLWAGGFLSEEEKRAEWLFNPFDVVDRWWEDEIKGKWMRREGWP